MKNVLLIGNFGVGNTGDEALRQYFLETFPSVHWKVISGNPIGDELARLPGGIRSLLSFRWIGTVRALRTADSVVFGGGSLFTDTESVYACFLWWLHARIAHLFAKPIHFAFQGIGPFHSKIGEWFTMSALSIGSSISVRDALSLDRAYSMAKNKKVVLSFDPVFHLIKNKKIELRSQKILILIPRKNSGDSFLDQAKNALQQGEWERVRILCMQFEDEGEREYSQKLAREFGGEVIDAHSLDGLCEKLWDGGLVVSERYHGALAALALGIPTEIVSQKDGDKLSSLRLEDPSTWDVRIEAGRKLLEEALIE